MADQMSSIGGPKPRPNPHLEQAQLKNKNTQEKPEARLAKGEDTVSLEQTKKTEQTYGPSPGVAVGSPYDLLRHLVIKTLQDQGAALQIDTGSQIIDLKTLTAEDAQELISEDGYFGVEQTSQRIVDFAINAFGNDPAKLEEIKASIADGFKQAAGVFGGELPEISHQTYEAIMEKLDAFAKGFETATKD